VPGLDRQEDQDQHRKPDTSDGKPKHTVAALGQEVLGGERRDDLKSVASQAERSVGWSHQTASLHDLHLTIVRESKLDHKPILARMPGTVGTQRK
jgi:hypothetical protein